MQKIIVKHGQKSLSLLAPWLRQNCLCPKCVHPVTKQTLVHPNPNLKSLKIFQTQDKLNITWSDGHSSSYDLRWLIDKNKPLITRRFPHLWGKDFRIPKVDYNRVMETNSGLFEWISNIKTFGIGMVVGCPQTPEATKALSERISFIRQTHYGKFWDFTSNLQHNDTAYTTLALEPHTDTTYFTDPIGIQIFHLLHHKGKGGKSIYIDSFKIANKLGSSAYSSLSTYQFTAKTKLTETSFLNPATPITHFSHFPQTPKTFENLYQVKFNLDDQEHPIPLTTGLEEYYWALSEFRGLMNENKIEVQLEGGSVVAMDNWRVLHGRTEFDGERRMCGCYIGMDDFMARWAELDDGRGD